VNVFGADAERYPTGSPQESLARGAEVHFFPDEPYAFRRARHEDLMARIFGLSRKRLFVPGDDLCWHGFRTIEGLRRVREMRARLAPGG
jgi:hypothetical protein